MWITLKFSNEVMDFVRDKTRLITKNHVVRESYPHSARIGKRKLKFLGDIDLSQLRNSVSSMGSEFRKRL
jgi:hypothetical protein